MSKLFVSLLTLVALATALPAGRAGGKASSLEEVVKQMLDTMDTLTTTLATIRDEATAEEALPPLRKAAGKWQLIKKKAEDLAPPTREEKERLAKEYKKKLEEAQKKLFGEVARVSSVPGGRKALQEISGVLDKKAK